MSNPVDHDAGPGPAEPGEGDQTVADLDTQAEARGAKHDMDPYVWGQDMQPY